MFVSQGEAVRASSLIFATVLHIWVFTGWEEKGAILETDCRLDINHISCNSICTITLLSLLLAVRNVDIVTVSPKLSRSEKLAEVNAIVIVWHAEQISRKTLEIRQLTFCVPCESTHYEVIV
jgi:hypothetical protein